MKKDVIIVGGGIGGLCSGIYLLHKGFNVTIVEQKEKLGGKINIIEEEGFKFDLSASILMTPKIYTDVFEDVGKNYKDYFEIINLDPLYKVFSYDKKSLLIYGDSNKMINEFEKFEKGLSLDFMKFLSKSYEKYYLIKNDFLDKPMINLKELLNLNSIKSLIKIKPLSTTSNYLNKIIKNENKTAILVTHDISEAISLADTVAVLSHRPTTIQSVHKITLTLEGDKTPLTARLAPEFKDYFDLFWKELQNDEERI